MEEKKKRWRPSLTAYRKLESEVSTLKAEISRYEGMRVEYENAILKNSTLAQSNHFMEKELENLRSMNNDVTHENMDLRDELFALKSRGLLARLFNKNV